MSPIINPSPRQTTRLSWEQVKALEDQLSEQGQELDFVWHSGYDIVHFEHIYSPDCENPLVCVSFTVLFIYLQT